MTFRILVLCFISVVGIYSADAGFNGSILGFVYDSAYGVQPIHGLPGAAIIGSAVKLSNEIADLIIAPRGTYGLATTSDSNLVVVHLTDPSVVQPLGIPIT